MTGRKSWTHVHSKHMNTDLSTGRTIVTTTKGNVRTLPTLVMNTPHEKKTRVRIMKALHPVNTKGGPIQGGAVCLWYTPIEKLFETGGDYSHILNFERPYHAERIELGPPVNADIEE